MTATRMPMGRAATWGCLLVGAVLMLGAQHGHPAVAVAAWLFAIPLLRFTRSLPVVRGMLALAAVHVVAAAIWVLSIRMPSNGLPVLEIGWTAVLNLVLMTPFLLDRLVAVRLRVRHPVLATLVHPTARVGAELAVVGLGGSGIVFGVLATTQHEMLPLLQISAVTGMYGVSFLVAWLAPAVVELWQDPSRLRPLVVVTGVIALVAGGGGLVMSVNPPQADTVRIAGLTPSRDLETAVEGLPHVKAAATGDPEVVREAMHPVIDDLTARTRAEARAGARIILWSEAAVWLPEQDLDALLDELTPIAREHRSWIQISAGLLTEQSPYSRNVITMVGPDGQVHWTYDKARPIEGLEQLTPGTEPPPAEDTEHGRLAAMICYDLDYSDLAAVDADIVLLPAGDWEGFHHQHTERTLLRAVEHGYTLIRQDAHGLAAAFDPQGRTLAAVQYHHTDAQTLVAEVPTRGTDTPYTRIGDAFAWTCVAGLTLLVAGAFVRPRSRTAVAG